MSHRMVLVMSTICARPRHLSIEDVRLSNYFSGLKLESMATGKSWKAEHNNMSTKLMSNTAPDSEPGRWIDCLQMETSTYYSVLCKFRPQFLLDLSVGKLFAAGRYAWPTHCKCFVIMAIVQWRKVQTFLPRWCALGTNYGYDDSTERGCLKDPSNEMVKLISRQLIEKTVPIARPVFIPSKAVSRESWIGCLVHVDGAHVDKELGAREDCRWLFLSLARRPHHPRNSEVISMNSIILDVRPFPTT